MLHPDTRLHWIDDFIGYGVVARRRIPKGTILWVLDPLDQVIAPKDVARLPAQSRAQLDRYAYLDRNGSRVLCWDFGRYMNHSCEPVSLSPGTPFELAVRDIEEGDELTCDYASLNLESELECRCGSPRCRGVVRPEDFERLVSAWDERLRDAIPWVTRVPQPLARYAPRPDRLARWAARPDLLPSAAEHRYFAPESPRVTRLPR